LLLRRGRCLRRFAPPLPRHILFFCLLLPPCFAATFDPPSPPHFILPRRRVSTSFPSSSHLVRRPHFTSMSLTQHGWNSRAQVFTARAWAGGVGWGGTCSCGVHVSNGGVVAGIRIATFWFTSLSSLAFESSSFLSLMLHQLGQRGRGEKRATTNVMDQFRDALCRPPTSWVPPCVCPSPIPLSSECVSAHIPLERGGADAATSSLVRELRCC